MPVRRGPSYFYGTWRNTMRENENDGMPLVAPQVVPPLDPTFRPAALANRRLQEEAQETTRPVVARLALEQPDGSVFHLQTLLLPPEHPRAAGNLRHLERLAKFALWSCGGCRLYVDAPVGLAEALAEHYRETPTGRFDAEVVGERIFDRPLEVVATTELPEKRSGGTPLGRHLEGCRIGFDLGGSDRKSAAVRDGEVVWSEEIEWDPYHQPDPQYHFDGIMDSLRRAATHLPRVDAIGGSAAGVYVHNQVKFASLFRGVAPDVFDNRVKNILIEIKHAFQDVPFEVINDGAVTALAGSMALGEGGVLGLALGTSTAAGFVADDGSITARLDELAFAPIDYQPAAARDEWSGDYGCGVQYLSQQAVGRLMAPAGIEIDEALPLPRKLKQVQAMMKAGDARARRIYETIGVYLGYAVAHYASFYDFRHVLLLGRVTSGPGGEVMVERAREALRADFPELAARTKFHMPDETQRRHGQAIAAASLPVAAV
jgi:predicted NBD/HSP70 family sugar kinase